MECKCGGSTAGKKHSKTENGEALAELYYEECTACKRATRFLLKQGEKYTTVDARLLFNEICGE
jgi:hypothetical protein